MLVVPEMECMQRWNESKRITFIERANRGETNRTNRRGSILGRRSIFLKVSLVGICGKSSGIMMGEEEASVAAVNSGDNRNKNCLKWIPEVTAKEPCAKKLAKPSLKVVKELENSFGKELPEEVPYVEKCYQVSNSNLSLEEDSSCLQTFMTKFILKRSGDKWLAEVTARAPCAKKQAKEVSNPNSSPEENASCFRTMSSQKLEKKNEPLDQRSYMDALGREEGMINRPRPYFSHLVQQEKRKNVGRTKKRSNDLHRSLFLPTGLQDGTKLVYCVKKESILEGYKQGNGIVCSHCNTKISPSDFEAHAGYPAKRKPYHNICTTDGVTLHDIALWLSGQSIQRSSHNKCAKTLVLTEDILALPFHNLYRVVKPPIYQPGGCVLCRVQDFTVDTFDELKISSVTRQYHVRCLLDNGLGDLEELSKDKWFCCSDCNNIHSTMQGLLKENKVLLVPVLEKDIGKGVTNGAVNSMHCQILSGTSPITDSRLLSKAAAIFKESFKTIRSKTCSDLIAAAVHGKNISDQESRQIYCMVLIVESVVSSACVLRIISREIAELPVVATSKRNRRKGYFQALFSCIEQLLISINVKKIVLPAAKVAESMWTNKLGFKKISDEQLSEYTKDFQLTMFLETSMLEKVLSKENCKFKVVEMTSELADSSGTSVMEEVPEVQPVAN
ncbi:hypothetical protein POM88_017674 [Heracleum sosnowskyi]|uniref:Tify domain-containing protein n=1 Tax=Heracleum sosnowskyi TaxID=360622 RepID=A0AAD8IPW4_9APIA|nr:hypothetical protein POM88_017674 [Heracleum sosnowskyi]